MKTHLNPSLPRWLTPPAVAEALGVAPEKVVVWIRRGELRAINVAEPGSIRPRYRISQADLEAFERSRQVIPPPPTTPRRKRQELGIVEFV